MHDAGLIFFYFVMTGVTMLVLLIRLALRFGREA
jgi:hypothetical protein